jgi:hypothetical protein
MMASYGISGAMLVVLDVRTLFVTAGAAGLGACVLAVRLLRGVARPQRAAAEAARVSRAAV